MPVSLTGMWRMSKSQSRVPGLLQQSGKAGATHKCQANLNEGTRGNPGPVLDKLTPRALIGRADSNFQAWCWASLPSIHQDVVVRVLPVVT